VSGEFKIAVTRPSLEEEEVKRGTENRN